MQQSILKLGFRKKENLKEAKEFIFNLKLMAFMDQNNLNEFFKLLSETYTKNHFVDFLKYFIAF